MSLNEMLSESPPASSRKIITQVSGVKPIKPEHQNKCSRNGMRRPKDMIRLPPLTEAVR
ncbi:hypothetical protein NEILACOT_04527 [Neisseria lactamica ATCC 23970]|uniref:Uncharacterized protein n=1 Tax=Neisseria lactamica ATCC 23970 TaxID=546265 RepID=D0WAF7_NEILA|nr:hypothetical protein NEILACOT_04527 [Neisseria lactamica ATCC 23970]